MVCTITHGPFWKKKSNSAVYFFLALARCFQMTFMLAICSPHNLPALEPPWNSPKTWSITCVTLYQSTFHRTLYAPDNNEIPSQFLSFVSPFLKSSWPSSIFCFQDVIKLSSRYVKPYYILNIGNKSHTSCDVSPICFWAFSTITPCIKCVIISICSHD